VFKALYSRVRVWRTSDILGMPTRAILGGSA
jgi:hypothetical protein